MSTAAWLCEQAMLSPWPPCSAAGTAGERLVNTAAQLNKELVIPLGHRAVLQATDVTLKCF